MTYRRFTRALHVLLLLSGIFALSALGTLLVRANKLMDHAIVTVQNVDRTVVIAGVTMTALQKAEKGQLQQLAASQAALNGTIMTLQESVRHTDENINGNVLPSVTMAVGSLNDSIQDFRGKTQSLMDDAHQNLLVLGDTQKLLNQKIADLDISGLGRNLNLMASQGVTISRNTASATGHLDRITADAQQE